MLKLSVLHDRDGNITSIAAYPPDVPPAYPVVGKGQFLAELELEDIDPVRDADKVVERLDHLRTNFRVQPGSKASLMRRASGAPDK